MMNSLNPRFGSFNQSPNSPNGGMPGNSAFGLGQNQFNQQRRMMPRFGLQTQRPFNRPNLNVPGQNPGPMQSIAPSFAPSFLGGVTPNPQMTPGTISSSPNEGIPYSGPSFLGGTTPNDGGMSGPQQIIGGNPLYNTARRLVPIILLALLIPINLFAQTLTSITFQGAFDHEEITVSSTATNFTASKINPSVSSTGLSGPQARAELATFICDDNSQAAPNNQIRILPDNSTPTSSVGQHLLPNQMVLFYSYANITHAKFIRRGSNDVTCHAVYYRPSSIIP